MIFLFEENDVKRNTRQTLQRAAAFLTMTAVVLLFGLSSAVAQDAGGLTKYLSSQNDVVMGVNISELRSNKYYDQLIEWARSQAGGGEILAAFEDESGLDIKKDIDAISIAFRSTGSMNKQEQQREFVMAMSGTFKAKKLVAAIKKESPNLETEKNSGITYYKKGDIWLAVPQDGLVLMTGGKDTYVGKNLATFGSQKNSIRSKKVVKKMLSEVDTSGDMWIAGDMSSVPASAEGPKPNSLGLELNFDSGLDVQLIAQMPSKEDAQTALKQMNQMQSQNANNPIVSMFGAKPLVDNLEIKASGSKVELSTEMKPKEFDNMIKAITQMAQSRGIGGASSGSSPSKDAKEEASDGAEADFN